MDALDVVEKLKSAKARAKRVPENLRILAGVMARRLPTEAARPRIGQTIQFDPRPYRVDGFTIPVTIVSPPDGHYMTTFFDVDPWSPSGRYLAVTRVPFIWRIPYPGDRAHICVLDLESGICTTVYETQGWGAQLGANVQWGADDSTLFCNDIVEGRATGVRIDLQTLDASVLDGPIYGLTADRRYSFSGNLQHINAGIPGYGVPEGLVRRERPTTARSRDEGIWRTDLRTGESTLFLSLEEIANRLPDQDEFEGGTYHVFNVKVNSKDNRLLAVIFTRGTPGRSGWPVQLMTCDLDGDTVELAMPNRLWRVGGHHPNWAPDGDWIVMNLRNAGEPMRFVRFRFDGSDLTTLAPGHKGSGHPSLDPTQRFLLTDAYTAEGFMDSEGRVPIRLIDLETNQETVVTRVYTNRILGPRRVDPHPVWSRDGRSVCFNGVVDGRRQVLIADLSGTV